jgi:hypothetical protein
LGEEAGLDDEELELLNEELSGFDTITLLIFTKAMHAIYNKYGYVFKGLFDGSVNVEKLTKKEVEEIKEHHEKLEKPRESCRRITYHENGKVYSMVVCEDGYYKFGDF